MSETTQTNHLTYARESDRVHDMETILTPTPSPEYPSAAFDNQTEKLELRIKELEESNERLLTNLNRANAQLATFETVLIEALTEGNSVEDVIDTLGIELPNKTVEVEFTITATVAIEFDHSQWQNWDDPNGPNDYEVEEAIWENIQNADFSDVSIENYDVID